jgi:peptide/nickel transport system substrate-binding protein
MNDIRRRTLLGAAAATLAAAALPPGAAIAQAKDSVVIGMSLEPPVLDPTLNAAAAIREITYQNIYESLTRIGRDGSIGPGLAESWTASPDGKTWTFKLRSGVKYHDGEPMTSEDVKFSLDKMFAANSTAPAKSLFATFESVEAVDPLTVKIVLKSPDAFLLYNVGLGDAAIQGRKSAANNGKHPIGTGPFMFKERKEGASLTLVKAPTYRDPASIKLNTVTFRFFADPQAQVSALLAGDVDAFPGFQAPELVNRVKADPRFSVVIGSTEGETILATNNGEGRPGAKLQVRQAIAHAIDREELVAASSGFPIPIGSHFPTHHPAYVDMTKTYPLDLAKAKKLLADAGYPSGFEATLKLPPVGYAQRAGEVLQSQLGKIGIRLKIVQLQWPQWLSEVFREKNYDFSIVAHTEANDIDRYARDGYYWGYVSQPFRTTYNEMVQTVDPAKRNELLKTLQKIIAEDAVNGYLFLLPKIGVWKKELVGMWENSPTPSIDLTGVYWK